MKKRLKNERVLIVEDSQDTAEALAMFLRNEGAGVAVAVSESDALVAICDWQPTIIVTDIHMGWFPCSGITLMNKIKTGPHSVPVIGMTGWPLESRDERRLLEEGFDDFLKKPVDDVMIIESCLRVSDRRDHGELSRPSPLGDTVMAHMMHA